MDRRELPLIAPQFAAHHISAADVVALASFGEVPGVNYDDPRIQEIRSCVLGIHGMSEFQKARKDGYLHDRGQSMHDLREPMVTLWRWWCTAAGHPHIVISGDDVGLQQVSVNLISAGKRWLLNDLPAIGEMLADVATFVSSDQRIAIDDRRLVFAGLDSDDAITIARRMVEYTTTGEFKARRVDRLPNPDPFGHLAKPLIPMERSDDG